MRRRDWRCCYGGLTRRCGRSCRGFAGAGDKHDRKHRKHRPKNNRFLHSVNCFFTNNSSQVASADVLKDKKFCAFASRPTVHISRKCIIFPELPGSNLSRNTTFYAPICQMSIFARCFFSSPRFRLASRIRRLSAAGRGERRRRAFSRAAISAARRFCSTSSIASSNRSRASLRFCACERESSTVTLIPLGRCRNVTAVATLFTFWPPGPLDRANVSSRSAPLIPRFRIRSCKFIV
jgi:hypothetical protein